jgi:hypothetical protein
MGILATLIAITIAKTENRPGSTEDETEEEEDECRG